jgi:hypothetical protein
MPNIEYANAYSEVLEILRYVSIDDYNKIPKKQIEFFEKNSNKDYNFFYNPYKTLDEQNVSKRTKAIIAIIFKDYWATDIQKEKIIAKQNYDRMQLEKEKQAKYSANDIFKNKKSENIENSTETLVMTEYKETFLDRIINKINKIFKK